MSDAVVVTSRSFGSGAADPASYLNTHGLKVREGPSDHDLEASRPLLREAAAWIAGVGPIAGEHLDLAPRLKVIARYGVGVDSVDLGEAARRGVVVTNTPGANAEAVADYTLALILVAVRHVIDAHKAVRTGHASRFVGRDLGALTVGLVGFGAVGRRVARRLAGFGSDVLAYDKFLDPETIREHGVTSVGLEALLNRCDLVSLHIPAGPQPLLDAESLRCCKTGAVIVNTARAELIDEQALAAELQSGRLAAAAVDVVDTARPSPLMGAPNVVATPHIAAQTIEAIDRMGMAAAEDVVRVVIHGMPPHNAVHLRSQGVS